MSRPIAPQAKAIAEVTDRAAIAQALVAANGNVRKVAKKLGISHTTLHNRIKTFGLRDWLTATYPRSARQTKKVVDNPK